MNGPTTDHNEIRRWAESHGASPAEIFRTSLTVGPRFCRFIFSDSVKTPELRKIDCESFFATFDLLGLSFVYDSDHHDELLQIEEKSVYRLRASRLKAQRRNDCLSFDREASGGRWSAESLLDTPVWFAC